MEKKFIYIPSNLEISDLLSGTKFSKFPDGNFADKFCYFLHLIYEQRALYKIDSEFVPLKSSYIRRIVGYYRQEEYAAALLPKDKKHLGIERYREELLNLGVIECDGFYIKDRKSYGYKFTPEYSGIRHKRQELTDKTIKKNLKRWKEKRLPTEEVYKTLYNYLEKIEIDKSALIHIEDFDIEEYNSAKIAIDKLLERDFYLYKDDYGRIHTNITSIKASLRKFLSFNKKKLVNVDIINSQPLILLLTEPFKQKMFDDSKENADIFLYKNLVENGELYNYMMDKVRISDRKGLKEKMFKEVFFGIGVSPYFSQLFPSVSKLLIEIKRPDYRKLAWMMQRAESDLIINRICRRIIKEHKDLFIATIHDSILTVEDGIDRVKSIISDEFRKMGLTPSVRVES